MKFFSKNSMKKMAIVLAILTLFNFIVPSYSQAAVTETLFNPVKDLLVMIGDGIMSAMQYATLRDWTITEPSSAARGLGWLGVQFSRAINNFTFGAINNIDDLADIGVIKYTPDKIFANEIPLFDINFFKPAPSEEVILDSEGQEISYTKEELKNLEKESESMYNNECNSMDELIKYVGDISTFLLRDELGYAKSNTADAKLIQDFTNYVSDRYMEYSRKERTESECVEDIKNKLSEEHGDGSFKYAYFRLKEWLSTYEENTKTEVVESSASILKGTVSKWYLILRTIAIVSMISVLVYTGIRIIISSTAKDKAKYKQMLVDWLVAMCLLFGMHYIMSFSFNIVDKITDLLGEINGESNFFNAVRTGAGLQSNALTAFGNMFMYLILVCITIYFTFVYLKRVIYMAFLTLIAPLVAFTYPIDKINDGKAQAFDMWFKEYIFNLLIQPMHLILYTILIGAAQDLANTHIIYAIVALCFITQAEKLLRKFFGFEKAGTPGVMPGTAAGALMMQGIQKLTGWGPHGSNNKSQSSKESGSTLKQNKIKMRSVDPYATMGAHSGAAGGPTTEPVPTPESSSTPTAPPTIAPTTESGQNALPNMSDLSPLEQAQKNGVRAEDYLRNVLAQTRTTPPTPPTPPPTPPTPPIEEPSRFRRAINKANQSKPGRVVSALSAMNRAHNRGLRRKIKNKARDLISHPLRKTGKFVAKAAGGIVGGTLGLAIGAATGNPQQALQNAIIGAKGGSNLTGRVADTFNVDGTDEAFKAAYYGDEYKEHLYEKQHKKWQEENEEHLIRNLGEKRYKELKKKGTLKEYTSAGIYNIEDVIAAEQFKEKHHQYDTDDAIRSVKIANYVGDYQSINSQETKDQIRESVIRNYIKAGKDRAEAEQWADMQLGYADEIHKSKKAII